MHNCIFYPFLESLKKQFDDYKRKYTVVFFVTALHTCGSNQ